MSHSTKKAKPVTHAKSQKPAKLTTADNKRVPRRFINEYETNLLVQFGEHSRLIVKKHEHITNQNEHKTRGQSNLTKSASRGPIPRLGVTPGVESCTIEFLG